MDQEEQNTVYPRMYVFINRYLNVIKLLYVLQRYKILLESDENTPLYLDCP